MSVEISLVEQGSPEWFDVRKGIPTASMLNAIMAAGKDGGASLTRKKYMRQLAGEIITEKVDENRYKNAAMERGQLLEPEARSAYEFATENTIELVGFVLNREKNFGYSPDFLIGSRGAGEIKTKQQDLLIECIEADRVPPQHVKQLQGGMWASERDWVDLAIYWPGLPLFLKHVERNDLFCSTIAEAVAQFNYDLGKLVERIRNY